MKVHIAIDTKTFVRFWLVVIGFALGFLAIYQARVALILVGTSTFLALVLNAPVSALTKYLPGRSRIASTAIAYLAIVVLLSLMLFLVIPPIIEQSVKLVDTLPSLVNSAATQWQGVSDLISKYHLQGEVNNAVESVKHNVTSWAGGLSSDVLGGINSLASWIASAFLMLVLTFLMLVEGPEWIRRIWGLYDDNDRLKRHKQLASRMYDVVNGYVIGQLIISALDGLLAGLFVFVISFFLDVPANLALPSVAILFVFSLIPMFGATIGGALVALLLALNDPTAAIIFVVYFIVYQQVENNLIAPSVQSKRLELSPLAILVAVTIGLYVFGLAGGIISIPIAGCIKVLIEDYLAQNKKKRKKNDKPLAKLVKKVRESEA